MLFLTMLLTLHAAPAIYDDESVEGFHYHCTNLKGALVVNPDGHVKFVFPEPRDVREAGQIDRDIVPPGKGGRLLFLSAWAAGTVVRLPEAALAGAPGFRLPWSNWSYMGHGSARGTGTCARTK